MDKNEIGLNSICVVNRVELIARLKHNRQNYVNTIQKVIDLWDKLLLAEFKEKREIAEKENFGIVQTITYQTRFKRKPTLDTSFYDFHIVKYEATRTADEREFLDNEAFASLWLDQRKMTLGQDNTVEHYSNLLKEYEDK